MTVLAEIAGMNLPQASDDAVQMLKYMTNFVAGLYTNGENGYAPTNGAAYWLYPTFAGLPVVLRDFPSR